MASNRNHVVNVRLDDEELEELERLVRATGFSRSAILRACFRERPADILGPKKDDESVGR